VLLSTDWIQERDLAESRISVDVGRDTTEDCPEFDPSAAVIRAVEERLHDFYGRPNYWRRKETAALD